MPWHSRFLLCTAGSPRQRKRVTIEMPAPPGACSVAYSGPTLQSITSGRNSRAPCKGQRLGVWKDVPAVAWPRTVQGSATNTSARQRSTQHPKLPSLQARQPRDRLVPPASAQVGADQPRCQHPCDKMAAVGQRYQSPSKALKTRCDPSCGPRSSRATLADSPQRIGCRATSIRRRDWRCWACPQIPDRPSRLQLSARRQTGRQGGNNGGAPCCQSLR